MGHPNIGHTSPYEEQKGQQHMSKLRMDQTNESMSGLYGARRAQQTTPQAANAQSAHVVAHPQDEASGESRAAQSEGRTTIPMTTIPSLSPGGTVGPLEGAGALLTSDDSCVINNKTRASYKLPPESESNPKIQSNEFLTIPDFIRINKAWKVNISLEHQDFTRLGRQEMVAVQWASSCSSMIYVLLPVQSERCHPLYKNNHARKNVKPWWAFRIFCEINDLPFSPYMKVVFSALGNTTPSSFMSKRALRIWTKHIQDVGSKYPSIKDVLEQLDSISRSLNPLQVLVEEYRLGEKLMSSLQSKYRLPRDECLLVQISALPPGFLVCQTPAIDLWQEGRLSPRLQGQIALRLDWLSNEGIFDSFSRMITDD